MTEALNLSALYKIQNSHMTNVCHKNLVRNDLVKLYFSKGLGMNVKLKSNAGFTMLEFVFIVGIIAVISTTATFEYLDFTSFARINTFKSAIQNIRGGISIQRKNILLRCGGTNLNWPNYASIQANDITAAGDCTTLEVRNPADRKFVQNTALPPNTYTNSNAVTVCEDAGCDDHCNTDGCDNSGVSPGGWCYNPVSGEFWADSQLAVDADQLECEL